jgi:hypothetical protein
MSEKPTCSSREARRRTVGEVVTVWIRFLPGVVRGKADYTENRTSQEGRLAPALATAAANPLFLDLF